MPLAAIRDHPGSYSLQTLSQPAALEERLGRIGEQGREKAPALFTATFVERMTRRLRWTAVRRSGAGRLRVILAYIVMCPFDLLPTLWHRALGWLWVRSRTRWTPP